MVRQSQFSSSFSYFSFKTDLSLNMWDSVVKQNALLLKVDLFLQKLILLLLKEVHLIDIRLLKFSEVTLHIGDVFKDLLEDIIYCLSLLMFQSGTFTSQDLWFLLIFIERFSELTHIELQKLISLIKWLWINSLTSIFETLFLMGI